MNSGTSFARTHDADTAQTGPGAATTPGNTRGSGSWFAVVPTSDPLLNHALVSGWAAYCGYAVVDDDVASDPEATP